MNARLRRELRDLALVAGGAIPGALLRWQLELVAKASGGGLRALTEADLLANLVGCLLIGLLLGQPMQRRRVFLWAGIGFCGSLTTFSSWMLELVKLLEAGRPMQAGQLLALSLLGGLALVHLGYVVGSRGPGGPKGPRRVTARASANPESLRN